MGPIFMPRTNTAHTRLLICLMLTHDILLECKLFAAQNTKV